MAKQDRKLTPEQDALEHILARQDEPSLEKRFIDSFKGRGVFTHKAIEPSTFVVEYRGNISSHKHARKKCGDTLSGFLFEFSWNASQWSVDASKEDGTLGRLVNDDHRSPNCEMRKVVCEGKPHLCLFAVEEISPGEEITYNYGESFYPWRSTVSAGSNSEESVSEDGSERPGPSRGSADTNTNTQLDSSPFTEGESSKETFVPEPDDDSSPQQERDPDGASDGDYDPGEVELKGKRTSFDSKNYCYVCGLVMNKLACHLRTHVSKEPEIAEALALPAKSQRRKRLLEKLRNRGNCKHNEEVLRNSCRKLKLKRRPKAKTVSAEEFEHCQYCKALFNRAVLLRHTARCAENTSNSETSGETSFLSEFAPVESQSSEIISSGVWKILLTMKQDEVAYLVKNDHLLKRLAQSWFEKYGDDPSKHDLIRQKLREMGRLLLALHEKSIFSFEDAIKPNNFYKVVDTVKNITGFNERKRSYKKPSLALKLGNSLKRLGHIVLCEADSDEKLVEDTNAFMKLRAKEWTRLVSQAAVASLSGRKVNSPSTIPFTRDVQAFYRYLEKTSSSATGSMETYGNPQAYDALCRVTLAQASVLNKCAPEVSRMTLQSFQERDDSTQVLSKHFIRINILGKTGQNVAVLLTSQLASATTLLVSKRRVCGVHDDNPFLFAKPDGCSTSLHHGGNCVRAFSSLCRANNPEHLRSLHLHKHMARIFQILNLENDELGHLAKLLGHDIRTDGDYYRFPEAAVELAKTAQLLRAMEKGSLERFKGNSLEEIEIEDELELDVEQSNPGNVDAEEDNEVSDLQQRDDVEQRAVESQPDVTAAVPSPGDERVEDSEEASSSAEWFSGDEDFFDDDPNSNDSFGNNPDSSEPPSFVEQLADTLSVQQDATDFSDVSDSDGEPKDPTCTKKNYCYVCGKAQSKISRHLFTHRKKEAEIDEAFAAPSKSKKRKKMLEKLRNKGNYQHNQEVLKTRKGQLKVRRLNPSTPKIFATCIHCQGMYSRKELWRHLRKCPLKKCSDPLVAGNNQILSMVASTGLTDPQDISLGVKKMLKKIKKDEIGSVVWNDPYILQLAQCLYYMNETKLRDTVINQKMRQLGRLLLTLKKKSMGSFEDACKPQNFSDVVEAVRQTAGYNDETKSFDSPTLLAKLGNSLKKIADIKYARALKDGANIETIQEAETFIKLCAKEWPSQTPSKLKVKRPPTLPFTRDVQLFYKCVKKVVASAAQSLTLYESSPVYKALIRVTLAYLSVLNKNAREVSKITLQSFKERDETEPREDAAVRQSQFEQILSKHTVKINVVSNSDTKMALSLTPELLSALTLLVDKREACGVHKDNPYLFGRPLAKCDSFYQGLQCVGTYVTRCGAENQESLRSTFFRKHTERIFQILSLTDDELERLAKLLRRDIRTDGEYYQTPAATEDIARISALLSAMEDGYLGRFEGKPLEEIEIVDEVQPVVEPITREDGDAEGGNKGSGSYSAAKKRKHGSRKKENENEPTELIAERNDVNAEKEDVSETSAVDTPEETPSRSEGNETNVYFSDDHEDMNLDFDMDVDTDDDGRNEEDDGGEDSKGSAAKPAIPDGICSTKLGDSGHRKKRDTSPSRHSTDGGLEENMDVDTENHAKETDPEEDHNEEDDWMDADSCGSPATPSTVFIEKKSNLSAALAGMKDVKILIQKLDIEKVQALVHISQFSSLSKKSPVKDQHIRDVKKQREAPSAPTEVTKKPSDAKAVHMSCSHCNTNMMKGQTAYQKKGFTDVFCSKSCLFALFPHNKPAAKRCHSCLKAISQPLDLIMAAVDSKRTMKEFCSVACLSSFKSRTASTETPVCSMCSKSCTATCELTLNETVYRFCSNACLEGFCKEGFCRDNRGVCENCRSACRHKPLTLKLSDGNKTICGVKCLEEFKEKTKTLHVCTMCHVSRRVSNMVHHVGGDDAVELFCTRTCVISHKLRSAVVFKIRGTDRVMTTPLRPDWSPAASRSDAPPDAARPDSSETIITADSCVVCNYCGKPLPKGQKLHQSKSSKVFCSPACLSEKLPHVKLVTKKCYNCFQVILRPRNVILAPVDDSGTVRELCSDECLSSVTSMRKTAVEPPPPEEGPPSECRMCHKFCHCKLKTTRDDVVHGFCSNSCLVLFHRVNNLPLFTCDVCGRVCLHERLVPKMEDGSKNICGDECLVKFKETVETRQLCPTCLTSHLMSDMVESKTGDGRLNFFCSNRCMTASETDVSSSEEKDIKEVKPPLLNLDCIKEEPVDEEYSQSLPASVSPRDIKDEPNVTKQEDLKIGSVLPLTGESESSRPTLTQRDLLAACSNCKKLLMDRETVFQRKGHADIFCATSCLLKFYQMKTVKKTCHFCLQVITRPQDALRAPPDDDGTKRDFCSRTCMSSFNYKTIKSTKIPIVLLPSHSQCSMCCRYCISKHELVQQDVVHKICSDPCFLRFCSINKLSVCLNCRCSSKTPLTLKMESGSKTLCGAECLAQFRQKNQTVQPCAMCRASNLISDMVESKSGDDVVELFCSSSCVMASKIQALSASGAPLNCDRCGTVTAPACHLAMSDASIRNFCSLTCAMTFKETQKHGTSPTASDQTFHRPAEKLSCSQCQRVIKTRPKVIQTKEKLYLVCSLACSQEFRRVNTAGTCEYCKNERIISHAKRVDDKLCYFCSDGCKMLFRHELAKTWGKHCRSCARCLSVSRTLVTAEVGGADEEFCSEDCSSNYKLLHSDMAECDACGRTGKLKQRLPLLGEVKHFCDLKCLLHFCNRKIHTVDRAAAATESSPVIARVISLARRSSASAGSAPLGSVADVQAKVVGHVGIQTLPHEVKNKPALCPPLVHNKGVSCTAQTVETETQTDDPDPDILPVPVPVYLPLPMNTYSQYTPTPVGLPLPLPVPSILPETPDVSEPTVKEKTQLDSRPEMEAEQVDGNERDDGHEGREGTREEERQEALSRKDPSGGHSNDSDSGHRPAFNVREDGGLGSRRAAPSGGPRPELPPPAPKGGELQHLSKKPKEETSHGDFTKVASRSHRRLKSQSGVDTWKRWIHWRESQTHLGPVSSHAVTLKADLLRCSAAELSDGLCCFVSEVRRPDGEPYSPDSLFYLLLGIQQCLFDNGRMENIFSDPIYDKFSTEFTEILKRFKPSVTAGGYIHSRVEEDFLWGCKQLGAYSPIVLLNTLLFFCCKCFGFTAVEQHRQLSFAHVMLFTKTNHNNTKTTFLRFYPPISVTEVDSDTNGVPAKKRKKKDFLEMMENTENPLRCPVRIYEFYLSKCSQAVRQRTDVFYLHPDRGCVPSSPLWFSATPLDDGAMGAMIARILAVRELQGDDRGETAGDNLKHIRCSAQRS
ncbi:uncharacterized protein [Embiotoca jacksoni]|uniref:uncharacterized protein isoform X3 n=1 Tax=Embiotoca jacksoni TaxID=100190 RepID=UPI003704315A